MTAMASRSRAVAVRAHAEAAAAVAARGLGATIALLALTMLFACAPGWRTWSSAVASSEMTIAIAKLASQGGIHRLEIDGEAQLDGEAELLLLAGETVVRSLRISGNAEISLATDWYADDARIVYRPTSATSGHLVLRYRFLDI